MPVQRPLGRRPAALAAAGLLALLAGRGARAQGPGGAAPAPCAGKELETTELPGAEGTDCAGMKAANQCGEAWMKDGGYCTCTCGGGAEDGGGGSAGAAPAPVGASCKGTELETTTLPGNDNKLDCEGMKAAGQCGADWMVEGGYCHCTCGGVGGSSEPPPGLEAGLEQLRAALCFGCWLQPPASRFCFDRMWEADSGICTVMRPYLPMLGIQPSLCEKVATDPSAVYEDTVRICQAPPGAPLRWFQKHPVRYTPSELKEFITAFDLFPGDEAIVDRMAEEGVTGKMFIKMDEVDLIDRYRFKVGPAKSFLANSRTFQAPKVPIPGNGLPAHFPPSTLYTTFTLTGLHGIDEVNFAFSASVVLMMNWEDPHVYDSCEDDPRRPETRDQDRCDRYWRPQVEFLNGRSVEVTYQAANYWNYCSSLNSGCGTTENKGMGYLIMEFTGEFGTTYNFKGFPMDSQALTIGVAIADARKYMVIRPTAAIQGSLLEQFKNKKADTLSGWAVKGVRAEEEAFVLLDWKHAAGDGPMKKAMEIVESYGYNITEEWTQSAATMAIEVERLTEYYTLNYVMLITLLTGLAFCVFLMDPADVGDRCALAITVVLALNVFQLILNDSIPKTGYLTPMHLYVTIATFLATFAAVESVLVFRCNARVEKKKEIVEALREGARHGLDEEAAADHWLAKAGKSANAVRPVGVEVPDGTPGAADGPDALSARPGPRPARLPLTLDRVEFLLAKWMDTASLLVFPTVLGASCAVIFRDDR